MNGYLALSPLHHEGEAQDVEQGEDGKGERGIDLANVLLVGGEDGDCCHGGSAEHHHSLPCLDPGHLGLIDQLTATDLHRATTIIN